MGNLIALIVFVGLSPVFFAAVALYSLWQDRRARARAQAQTQTQSHIEARAVDERRPLDRFPWRAAIAETEGRRARRQIPGGGGGVVASSSTPAAAAAGPRSARSSLEVQVGRSDGAWVPGDGSAVEFTEIRYS